MPTYNQAFNGLDITTYTVSNTLVLPYQTLPQVGGYPNYGFRDAAVLQFDSVELLTDPDSAYLAIYLYDWASSTVNHENLRIGVRAGLDIVPESPISYAEYLTYRTTATETMWVAPVADPAGTPALYYIDVKLVLTMLRQETSRFANPSQLKIYLLGWRNLSFDAGYMTFSTQAGFVPQLVIDEETNHVISTLTFEQSLTNNFRFATYEDALTFVSEDYTAEPTLHDLETQLSFLSGQSHNMPAASIWHELTFADILASSLPTNSIIETLTFEGTPAYQVVGNNAFETALAFAQSYVQNIKYESLSHSLVFDQALRQGSHLYGDLTSTLTFVVDEDNILTNPIFRSVESILTFAQKLRTTEAEHVAFAHTLTFSQAYKTDPVYEALTSELAFEQVLTQNDREISRSLTSILPLVHTYGRTLEGDLTSAVTFAQAFGRVHWELVADNLVWNSEATSDNTQNVTSTLIFGQTLVANTVQIFNYKTRLTLVSSPLGWLTSGPVSRTYTPFVGNSEETVPNEGVDEFENHEGGTQGGYGAGEASVDRAINRSSGTGGRETYVGNDDEEWGEGCSP